MHLQTLLPVSLLLALTTAALHPRLPPSSTSINHAHPTPTGEPGEFISHLNESIPHLNGRSVWDDIVHGAESLYSQAMATATTTPTTITKTSSIRTSSTSSISKTTTAMTTETSGSKKNGSSILERPGLLMGAGFGLVVLGLFA
ncbi:hypothetical protein QBC45DRAFT_435104 [Copromyces sp. CBS 386.78]|nr:hypothetical protein QBC45DRAFT_435104 [Copromyces sp. CBS 386.78]